jgi:hypothetical protein
VPTFGITPEIREKLIKISPATIGHALKKDKAALALKGKSQRRRLIFQTTSIRAYLAYAETLM